MAAAPEDPDPMDRVLGLPGDRTCYLLVAFGYPAGTRATKLRRNPVESFATIDRFDGPAFSGE